MKWGDAERLLDEAKQDGATTLGSLRDWLTRRKQQEDQQPEPEIQISEEEIGDILDWFRDQFPFPHGRERR
jgi:hypothetical protein